MNINNTIIVMNKNKRKVIAATSCSVADIFNIVRKRCFVMLGQSQGLVT